MKTLLLVRHAKSSWDDPSLPDKKRPLNDRGLRDAPKMGARLAKRHVKPDLVLSSPAVRALATAQIIATELDYRIKDIVVDERLYEAAPDDLLEIIRKLGDEGDCVMIFGHNPELSELARGLSDTITEMRTCVVAELAFDIESWSHVGRREPLKVTLHEPKRS